MADSTYFTLGKDERRSGDVDRMLDFAMRLSKTHVFEVEFRLYHGGLSYQQRRLYRKWLGEIAASTGDDAEALHEHFLKAYAPRVVVALHGGETVEVIKRTANGKGNMNKDEMSEFMTKVQRVADTMSIKLTQPMGDPTW